MIQIPELINNKADENSLSEQIESQNKFLNRIIESIDHPFYVIDAEHNNILYSNKVSGISPGSKCFNCLYGFDKPCSHFGYECPIEIIKRTKEPTIVIREKIDSKGNKKYHEIHSHPIFNESGDVIQIIEYSHDITQQKISLDKIKLSEERYRNLVDMNPYGIVEMDINGTIIFCNKTFNDILGYNAGELIGKKIWSFYETKEKEKYLREYFKRVAKEHLKPIVIIDKNIKKNGQKVDIKFDWDYRKDNNDKIIGFLAVVTDVTDQRRMFNEANQLANIVRQATDSIVLTDLKGNIIYVNPVFEKATGYKFQEVKGKNPRILKSINANYPPEYYEELWRNISSGKIWKGEFLNKKKNGEEYIEDASIFPIKDLSTGEIMGYGAVKSDITEKRKLEEKLQKSYEHELLLKEKAESANRLKSVFLANMSHDIRTPLNGILGFANLLMKKTENSQALGYVKTIINSGELLLNLLNDILDLSKIEAGQLDIYKQTFSISEILKSIKTIFEIQFKNANIQFSINSDKNLPEKMYNDKWRIHQVLSNLLSNTLKHSNANNVEINIKYDKSQDHFKFIVRDNGTGISNEHLKIIFDPFIQVESAKKYKTGGVGLGLAICKNLVSLIGGSIDLNSILGKGTEFKITIPAYSDKIEHELSNRNINPEQKTDISDKHDNIILLADDNLVNRELISEYFKNHGYDSILFAVNGNEAIEIAQKYAPDLVLMDIQMPELDGNEAIKYLRENGFKKPIIALSAYAMREDIDKSLKLGANDYITKPIKFDFFFQIINKYLKQKEETFFSYKNIEDTENKDKYLIKDNLSLRLKTTFISDVKEKQEFLNNAVINKNKLEENKPKIKSIAHSYKGNAGYFGLSLLEESAIKLDTGINNKISNKEIIKLCEKVSKILSIIIESNKIE